MIRLEGLEPLPAPPDVAAARLLDAGWLANAIPDAEVTAAGPDRAEWRVRPTIPFLNGPLDTVAEVVTRDGATAGTYHVRTTAAAAGCLVHVDLSVRPAAGGAEVVWSAAVMELTGLLRLAPKAMLQTAAQKVIRDVWATVRQKLAAG
jgi:carbon monoxide dehydrogenase subunit G